MRPYVHADFKEYCSLIKQCFLSKNDDFEDHIHRKYFNKDYSKKSIISLAIYKGNIVGQYNNTAYTFSRFGKTVEGYICQDMCVDRDHRGQGLIKKMAAPVYQRQDHGFTIGFSNKAGILVDKWSNTYTYHIVGQLSKVILPMGLTISSIKPFERQETTILSTILPENITTTIGIYKDAQYLNRRYRQHPKKNYQCFHILELGYIITKKEGTHLYISDIVISEKILIEEHHKIIMTIKHIAKKIGCSIIIFVVLYNIKRKKFFSGTIKVKRKDEHYLTIKIHDTTSFLPKTILNKEYRNCILGDIM